MTSQENCDHQMKCPHKYILESIKNYFVLDFLVFLLYHLFCVGCFSFFIYIYFK